VAIPQFGMRASSARTRLLFNSPLSMLLPLSFTFTNLNSPLKIALHRLQVANQAQFRRSDFIDNAVIACVRARLWRNRRERLRVHPDAPAQPRNTMQAWYQLNKLDRPSKANALPRQAARKQWRGYLAP
jgi:hypothetical protein